MSSKVCRIGALSLHVFFLWLSQGHHWGYDKKACFFMVCEERRSILFALGVRGSGSVDRATVALGEEWRAAGWRVTFVVFGGRVPAVLWDAPEGMVAKVLPFPVRSVGNGKALRALLAAREVAVVGEPWWLPRGVRQVLRGATRGLEVRMAPGLAAHASHRLSAKRWCVLGRYHDLLPRRVKWQRLLWFFCEALMLRPWPYFLGERGSPLGVEKVWRTCAGQCFHSALGAGMGSVESFVRRGCHH